ncbi:unnamed protein product, partial [Prorocentrum cordatum]
GGARPSGGGAAAAPLPSTVFGRLAAEGRQSALFTAGTWEGVMRLCGAAPDVTEATAERGLLDMRHWPAAAVGGERQATEDAVSVVEALLEGEDVPDLLALYLHVVDGHGHAYGFGPEVAEYRAAIEFADGQVARLVRAVERRAARRAAGAGPAEEWLFAVTTDHGGTSQGRMPRGMRQAFRECGCVQLGIPQTSLPGVHGLKELPQHTRTFQIFGLVPGGGGQGLLSSFGLQQVPLHGGISPPSP